jgi:hypothetical protein
MDKIKKVTKDLFHYLILFSLLDVIITYLLLPSPEFEGNPLSRFLIANYGKITLFLTWFIEISIFGLLYRKFSSSPMLASVIFLMASAHWIAVSGWLVFYYGIYDLVAQTRITSPVPFIWLSILPPLCFLLFIILKDLY